MYKHVEGELRSLIARVHRRGDFAHVSGNSGNPQKPRFRVQHFIERLAILIFFSHQVREDAGIDGTRTCAHHQTVERSEAHGGVDALAAADRSERTTVAKVAGDEF